jgi:hypothetical protein
MGVAKGGEAQAFFFGEVWELIHHAESKQLI